MGPWSPLALAEAVEAVLPDAGAKCPVLATRQWGNSKDAEGRDHYCRVGCVVGCMEGRRGIVNSEKGVR